MLLLLEYHSTPLQAKALDPIYGFPAHHHAHSMAVRVIEDDIIWEEARADPKSFFPRMTKWMGEHHLVRRADRETVDMLGAVKLAAVEVAAQSSPALDSTAVRAP